jgi:riboflavin kinase/FMN adenylyltransferase
VHIIQGVKNIQTKFVSTALTIGNFDGVHLGHQVLINKVVQQAKKTGSQSVVMTFEPHPVQALHPERKLHRIFDFEDQKRQLEALGIDALVIEPFSREFSQVTPDRYIHDWIYEPFKPSLLVVGYDFSFGANRSGSIDFLRDQGSKLGFEVEVVPPVKVSEVLVSSSKIREAIDDGNVRLAASLLGRRFYVEGIVERGAGRGRTIGVPTANLHLTAETIPARGVYCAFVDSRTGRHRAVVNVGLNPTFQQSSHQALSVEVHLVGVETEQNDGRGPNLYGEILRVEFVDRLRDERRFGSVDELVAQIRRDIDEGMRRLNGT